MGYSKEVYSRAAKRLERRREAARRENEARTAEIAARLPQSVEIRREMAETALAVTRLLTASPERAEEGIAGLRDRNLSLQQRLREILRAAGYPADYLKERTACELCGGGGYLPAGQGGMCGCMKALLREEALAALEEVSQMKNCTFESFDLKLYPDAGAAGAESPRRHMADVLDACKRYAAEFSESSPSLLMLGRTGLGKTHLSLAVCERLTIRGFGVIYTPVQKLTDRLEAAKFAHSETAREGYAAALDSVLSCDLLVLDDLGAEFSTQFSAAALYNVINSRLVEGRPSIVSTNLEPQEIGQRYMPRMSSRLMGGFHVLRFTGKDIRFEKKFRA